MAGSVAQVRRADMLWGLIVVALIGPDLILQARELFHKRRRGDSDERHGRRASSPS